MSLKKIAFITHSRDDLWEVARALMTAIEPELLVQEGQPVHVSVRGSFEAGKSMMPDAFREAWNLTMPYLKNLEQSWYSGTALGRPFVFYFLDGGRYRRDYWNSQWLGDVNKAGGIAFIHNSEKFSEMSAGLDIWLESSEPIVNGDRRVAAHSLSEKGTRHVELEVKDPRLLKSGRFMGAFNAVAAKFCKPSVQHAPAKSQAGMHVS